MVQDMFLILFWIKYGLSVKRVIVLMKFYSLNQSLQYDLELKKKKSNSEYNNKHNGSTKYNYVHVVQGDSSSCGLF